MGSVETFRLMKKRILVAMSGGVDSSVAAIMLAGMGYELVGITMKVWDYEGSGVKGRETGCCSLDSINDARSLAMRMGFPHYVMDLREIFRETAAFALQLAGIGDGIIIPPVFRHLGPHPVIDHFIYRGHRRVPKNI